MKKVVINVVSGLVILIVVLIGIVYGGAAVTPLDHVASRSARYTEPPAAVWTAIRSYEDFPAWRSTVDEVEPLSGADGWIERGSTGPLPLAVEESSPPRRLVLRIAADNLGFGGTWTYEIAPEGGGSRLTITENGTIPNALFRFMSRFVFGYEATIDTYLIDLGRKFGEETTPEPG